MVGGAKKLQGRDDHKNHKIQRREQKKQKTETQIEEVSKKEKLMRIGREIRTGKGKTRKDSEEGRKWEARRDNIQVETSAGGGARKK